jgi:hypothetical protein
VPVHLILVRGGVPKILHGLIAGAPTNPLLDTGAIDSVISKKSLKSINRKPQQALNEEEVGVRRGKCCHRSPVRVLANCVLGKCENTLVSNFRKIEL